jgi:hypothetical protein
MILLIIHFSIFTKIKNLISFFKKRENVNQTKYSKYKQTNKKKLQIQNCSPFLFTEKHSITYIERRRKITLLNISYKNN